MTSTAHPIPSEDGGEHGYGGEWIDGPSTIMATRMHTPCPIHGGTS